MNVGNIYVKRNSLFLTSIRKKRSKVKLFKLEVKFHLYSLAHRDLFRGEYSFVTTKRQSVKIMYEIEERKEKLKNTYMYLTTCILKERKNNSKSKSNSMIYCALV